ncbi:MAG: type II toxin-antitoxin system HicA family toxin [Methanocalculus sp.]|uniref:type II toxin-antitoxin system HicA family toxin n=1 Tax=Methanocalculus sp. TaxID=2004547 RepID=UPI00272895D7|nr:type II toxin-antitoxin system HicA family toxin [Methanocalculus sp.]MDO9539530.1 type II toxin-antitoxin system HicA family toxin [Methanocalculus sp.]
MPKSPVVSGYDLLKILGSLGYTVLRQRGSHVQMAKSTGAGEHTIHHSARVPALNMA